MLKLKTFDLQGQELQEVDVDETLVDISVNLQLIKDYLVALRKNARQWSANTRGRSEIAHSNAKPHPQKRTGRARQGCIKTAQYRGGATVFGPKPKHNQHVYINRKERRAAIRYLLAQKMCNGNTYVLKLDSGYKPKTKSVVHFLRAANIENKTILFLGDTTEEMKGERKVFYLSMRNIPKTHFLPITLCSGYDVMAHQNIVVFDRAVGDLINILKR